jgi:hypothetical protein
VAGCVSKAVFEFFLLGANFTCKSAINEPTTHGKNWVSFLSEDQITFIFTTEEKSCFMFMLDTFTSCSLSICPRHAHPRCATHSRCAKYANISYIPTTALVSKPACCGSPVACQFKYDSWQLATRLGIGKPVFRTVTATCKLLFCSYYILLKSFMQLEYDAVIKSERQPS